MNLNTYTNVEELCAALEVPEIFVVSAFDSGDLRGFLWMGEPVFHNDNVLAWMNKCKISIELAQKATLEINR